MSGTPHGNAHWATIDSLKENGFQINPKPSSSGFIFGKWVTASPGEAHPMHCALYEGKHYISNNRSPQFVCFRDDIPSGHILTVAPTRSGKGVGLVIPNLLNYDQNVIVIDPKGENYSITKAYRTGEMEQEFWCFDPFKLKYKNLHGFPVLKKATIWYIL